MIHDIPTLGRNDPLEKMYYLKAAETSDFLSNSLHARMEEKPENTTIKQKELLEADDIMEEGKAILKTLLSEVNHALIFSFYSLIVFLSLMIYRQCQKKWKNCSVTDGNCM